MLNHIKEINKIRYVPDASATVRDPQHSFLTSSMDYQFPAKISQLKSLSNHLNFVN